MQLVRCLRVIRQFADRLELLNLVGVAVFLDSLIHQEINVDLLEFLDPAGPPG